MGAHDVSWCVRILQKRYHPLIHSTKVGILNKQDSIQLTIDQYQLLEYIHLTERSEFFNMEIKRWILQLRRSLCSSSRYGNWFRVVPRPSTRAPNQPENGLTVAAVAPLQGFTLFETVTSPYWYSLGRAWASPTLAWLHCTLVSFPDPLQKAEKGFGVLSDISCHMGRGRMRKECHNCIFNLEVEFLTFSAVPIDSAAISSFCKPSCVVVHMSNSCQNTIAYVMQL